MKKQYGFTLQELAVVLAILALMAIASTPKAQSCNRYPGNPDAPLWGMNLMQTWRESLPGLRFSRETTTPIAEQAREGTIG